MASQPLRATGQGTRLRAGPPPGEAPLTVVLVHGRGGTAAGMLDLAAAIGHHYSYVAPEAPGYTWYPLSFLAPIEKNEPYLSAALRTLQDVVTDLERDGVGADRVAILGFSQGACLSLEFAARHARRYAGVFGLSGGLIGPPGTPRDYRGSFERTPVFLGCSDVDPHIPLERVHESAEVCRRLGAEVDERIYAGMGHTIGLDELDAVRAILRAHPGA